MSHWFYATLWLFVAAVVTRVLLGARKSTVSWLLLIGSLFCGGVSLVSLAT